MLGKSKPANAVGHCFLAEIKFMGNHSLIPFHGWVFQRPTVWLIHKGYHRIFRKQERFILVTLMMLTHCLSCWKKVDKDLD